MCILACCENFTSFFIVQVNSTKNEVKVEYVDYGGDAFVPPSSLRKRVALVDYPCQCYTFPIRSDILPVSMPRAAGNVSRNFTSRRVLFLF